MGDARLQATIGVPAPTVIIGARGQGRGRPGTADAIETRMWARTVRVWRRPYGVLVVLADDRPRGPAYLQVIKPPHPGL